MRTLYITCSMDAELHAPGDTVVPVCILAPTRIYVERGCGCCMEAVNLPMRRVMRLATSRTNREVKHIPGVIRVRAHNAFTSDGKKKG